MKELRRQKETPEKKIADLEERIVKTEKEEQNALEQYREARDQARRAERQIARLERQLADNQSKYGDFMEERPWENNLRIAHNVQNATFRHQREIVNTLLDRAGKEPIFTDE